MRNLPAIPFVLNLYLLNMGPQMPNAIHRAAYISIIIRISVKPLSLAS